MGAERVKGITIEIGGDVSGLDKALKGVNKEIKDTQTQLKDVQKLLKLDPTNTELLRQKHRLLGEAVGETKDKLAQLKEAEQQAQQQFKEGKISQAQYEALQREIISTENELKSLTDAASASNAALSQIGAVCDKISSGAGKVASATKGISTAAGAALGGIAAAGYAAAVASDDMNTLAKQTGLSTATLQKAQYAADLIDVSYDDFTGSLSKMTAKLRTNEEGFEELGIATRDANGELLGTEEIFWNAADALSQMDNETERDIAAQELFGKSAASLAGILDDGGAAFREIGQEAEDAGLILSQETLDGLNSVNDQIDELKWKAQGALAVGGAEALEALSPVIEDVVNAGLALLEWIGQLDEGQIRMLTTLLAVVAGISPVAKGISDITGAISKVMPVLSKLGSFISANIGTILPIAAIVAFVALIATKGDEIQALLQKLDDWLQGVFTRDWTEVFGHGLGDILNDFFATVQDIWGGIKGIFDGIIDFIRGVFTGDWERAWKGVKEIFKGIFDTLVGIAKAPLNAVIALVNSAIAGINKAIRWLNSLSITIPDWVPDIGGETFGFNIKEIGSIPYLAKGGILSSGSAIVGEAGPELLTMAGGRAVVQPLTGGTNLSGVESLLESIRDALGTGGGTIVVQSVLDGRVIGQTACRYADQRARAGR